MNLDEYIEKLAQIITSRENYQRLLGQMALELTDRFGGSSLKVISEDLKENHGLRISFKTLQNYRWVEDRTAKLNLPDDIPYGLRQKIAGSDKAEDYAKQLQEGASSADIFRQIRNDTKNKEICPTCGAIKYVKKTIH